MIFNLPSVCDGRLLGVNQVMSLSVLAVVSMHVGGVQGIYNIERDSEHRTLFWVTSG